MKRIVMTGGTSFLGRNILRGLLQEDCKIYALVRKTSQNFEKLPQDEKITYLYGSLDELEKIEKEVSHADYFLHFAWEGSGYLGRADREVQYKNIGYSMNALALAEKLGCGKFVFSGSQAEYGIRNERITEDAPCHPISEYGKAKLAFSKQAKRFCENKTMKFLHLRIFSVYGPGDRTETMVNSCVRKFNSGELMQLGPCEQKWNFLYISDLVSAIKKILASDMSDGIYNIASQDTRVLREFVKEIYALSNQTGSYAFGNTTGNPEQSPPLDADTSKIRKAAEWMPEVSFSEGIRQIMRFMAAEG